MNPDQPFPEFKRHAVQPVECLKRGWDLIRDQYWLFVGMSVVGLLMGNAVPLGILTGPMMCGLYIALLKRQANETIEFATLFKGFDFFVDGMIAGLLHSVPVLLIIAPIYAIYLIMLFTRMGSRGGEPDQTVVVVFLSVFGIYIPIMLILLIILAIGFAFAYPLIVDRRLSAVNAVKLSFQAGMANFWSLLGLLLLNGLLVFAGALFCVVGAYFVLPVTFAALAVAYTQVFGLAPRPSLYSPPPPPSFN
jgi:hypothetical protein